MFPENITNIPFNFYSEKQFRAFSDNAQHSNSNSRSDEIESRLVACHDFFKKLSLPQFKAVMELGRFHEDFPSEFLNALVPNFSGKASQLRHYVKAVSTRFLNHIFQHDCVSLHRSIIQTSSTRFTTPLMLKLFI